jgi:hypothetical protein
MKKLKNNYTIDELMPEVKTTLISRDKPKVISTKTKTDEAQRKLPMKNENVKFDKMQERVKTVILERLSQTSILQQAEKSVPIWIVKFLTEKEFTKPEYLLPILNWMTDKVKGGQWTDTDARRIGKLVYDYTKMMYMPSLHEATEREFEDLHKYMREKAQTTLDEIYISKPKKEDKKTS